MYHRLLWLVLAVTVGVTASAQSKLPLSSSDIDDIATLLKLEDTRQFDAAALARIVRSTHPEVRRRAAVAIARIADGRGGALLVDVRTDVDPEVAASAVFALGQLKDPAAVAWLGRTLMAPATPPVIAREAAQALGKIRSPEARSGLGAYLSSGSAASMAAPVVGEALLSLGRFAPPGDPAPVIRWTTSSSAEIRWRAAWALRRLRDPLVLSPLLALADDPSGEVRYWAMRGLSRDLVEIAKGDQVAVVSRLRRAVHEDPHRPARTEALKVLLQYDEKSVVDVLVEALRSRDTWMSVVAAEAAGRFASQAEVVTPALLEVADTTTSTALRITLLPSLVTLAPQATKTLALATALVWSGGSAARSAGLQALSRLGQPGLEKLDELISDPALATQLPQLQAARARSTQSGDRAADGGNSGRPAATAAAKKAAPSRPARPDVEYRQLVERWIVPDYNGASKPRAIWETSRGVIELELHPGDAPFGVEHFLRVVQSGEIVGTEFTRVVPNFVAQQQPIRDATTLRDEVNRRGLTRGNLSWASAGLDTGRPGYTLGQTPQPHNEGVFTSLGRVVSGMDVVDTLELGDRVIRASMK